MTREEIAAKLQDAAGQLSAAGNMVEDDKLKTAIEYVEKGMAQIRRAYSPLLVEARKL